MTGGRCAASEEAHPAPRRRSGHRPCATRIVRVHDARTPDSARPRIRSGRPGDAHINRAKTSPTFADKTPAEMTSQCATTREAQKRLKHLNTRVFHAPWRFLVLPLGCYRVTPIGPQTGGRFGQMQGFQVRHQATPWPVRWPGCGAQGSGRRSDAVVHPRWQPDRRMAVRGAAGGWDPRDSHCGAFTDAKLPNAEALGNWV